MFKCNITICAFIVVLVSLVAARARKSDQPSPTPSIDRSGAQLPLPSSVEQWLQRLAASNNAARRPVDARFPNWKKSSVPLATDASQDYDSWTGVAAQWPQGAASETHGWPAYGHHHGYGHGLQHYQHYQHHTPHIQYVPVHVGHHGKKHDLEHIWPLILLGVIFLPLLLGALLIPMALAFLTNLIQLIQLMQNNPLGGVVPNPVPGGRKKRSNHLSIFGDVHPYLVDKMMSISKEFEDGLEKFFFSNETASE